MNCVGVVRSVSSYIDGELAVAVREEFEVHLKECPECKVMVQQTTLTVKMYYDSDLVDFPAEVKTRLHQKLRGKIGERRE